jgi:hypothetical protein
MKNIVGQLIMGTVIMAYIVIENAKAQTPPAQSGSSDYRKTAGEQIEASLQSILQEQDSAMQRRDSQRTVKQILKLCSSNIEITRLLKESLSKAEDEMDDRKAAKLLQDALREAKAILTFKLYIEAPLPEGFPEPTPLGEIQLKKYPAYRLARTPMAEADTAAFWTLFTHIKKKDIAMTGPVEMTYKEAAKDKLQMDAMAFLYRTTKQGDPGKDEKVEVMDVAAMMAISLGMRGDLSKARLAEAKAHLDAWLEEHRKEYEVSGRLRVMGYNSPFVAADRRFTEVEIPVRRKSR